MFTIRKIKRLIESFSMFKVNHCWFWTVQIRGSPPVPFVWGQTRGIMWNYGGLRQQNTKNQTCKSHTDQLFETCQYKFTFTASTSLYFMNHKTDMRKCDNNISNKNYAKITYLSKMKELNQIVIQERLFPSIKRHLYLTKGHLNNPEGRWRLNSL